MNLEQQYIRLSEQPRSKGQKFVKELIKGADGDILVDGLRNDLAEKGGPPLAPKIAKGIKIGIFIAKAATGVGVTMAKKKKK